MARVVGCCMSVFLFLLSVLHRGASKYQDIALIDTKHFGKVYKYAFYI